MTAYADRRDRLAASLAADGASGFGLAKETSNLFRDRAPRARPRVDLSGFNHVIGVEQGTRQGRRENRGAAMQELEFTQALLQSFASTVQRLEDRLR